MKSYREQYLDLQAKYLKSKKINPDKCEEIRKQIYEILPKVKKESLDNVKSFFNNMKPFEDIEDIPEIPAINSNDYQKYIVQNLIRCGAIPKNKLEIGKSYKGTCRNASEAIWNGDHFIYKRTKFGSTYDEKINHFEDDTEYDVFVPLYEIKSY